MKKTILMAAASMMAAGFLTPASAQGIDCTAAVDAIEYYCNHRDQMDQQAAVAPVAATMPSQASNQAPPARHAAAPHKATHTSAHASAQHTKKTTHHT
jgi:hypothetical protein